MFDEVGVDADVRRRNLVKYAMQNSQRERCEPTQLIISLKGKPAEKVLLPVRPVEAAAGYQAHRRVGESALDFGNKLMRLYLAQELVAFGISHELDEAVRPLDNTE